MQTLKNMASSFPTLSFFLLILPLLLTPSFSTAPPSNPVTPGDACSLTPNPAFCRSVLPPQGSQNLYSYGRFSLAKSLSQSHKFLDATDRYLARSSGSLSQPAVRALQDCQLLLGLNIDFLSSIGSTANSTTSLLPDSQADTLKTSLSALITNQQTCLDGLDEVAQGTSKALSVPLSNGTDLYSVSLGLFNHAWAPERKSIDRRGFRPGRRIPKRKRGGRKGRSLLFHELLERNRRHSGSLPLEMSTAHGGERLGRVLSGRSLLQSSSSSGAAVMVADIVVVSQDGTGNFTTITDAVNSAPNNTDGSNGYYLIFVSAGVYQEYVSIAKNKKYLMMVGDGINQTVVTGDHNNIDGWTTFNSATFAVVGQGFVAVNMTFQNTAGAAKHQAVALRSGADLSTFYSCSFEGYQDTLYTHSMRQFYRECDIYGTVDYIFGNAAAVLQECNIYSRLPMQGQSNTITAQGRTDPNQNTGTSIQGCNLAAAADLAAASSTVLTYLGRPWKEYSRTVIMSSFLDSLITPAGWMPWSGDFALSTLYYAEFNNSGPGSGTSQRVSWAGYHVIGSADAVNFTVGNFLMGDNWLPQTGVPYSGGL